MIPPSFDVCEGFPCGHRSGEHPDDCVFAQKEALYRRLYPTEPKARFCHRCYPSAVASRHFDEETLAEPLAPSPELCQHCEGSYQPAQTEDWDTDAALGPKVWHLQELFLLKEAIHNTPASQTEAPPPPVEPRDSLRDPSTRMHFSEFLFATFGSMQALQEDYLPHVYAFLQHEMGTWPRSVQSLLTQAPPDGASSLELLERFAVQVVATQLYSRYAPDLPPFWKCHGLPMYPVMGYRDDLIPPSLPSVVDRTFGFQKTLRWYAQDMISHAVTPVNVPVLSLSHLEHMHSWEGHLETLWSMSEADRSCRLRQELTEMTSLWTKVLSTKSIPPAHDRYLQLYAALFLTWAECTFASHRPMLPSVETLLWKGVPQDPVCIWHPSAKAPLLELSARAVIQVCQSAQFWDSHVDAFDALVTHGPQHASVQALGVRTTQDREGEPRPPEELRPWIRALARRAGMYILPTMTEGRLLNYLWQSLRTQKLQTGNAYDAREVLYRFTEGSIFPRRNDTARNYRLWGFEDGWEDPDDEDADWTPEEEMDEALVEELDRHMADLLPETPMHPLITPFLKI